MIHLVVSAELFIRRVLDQHVSQPNGVPLLEVGLELSPQTVIGSTHVTIDHAESGLDQRVVAPEPTLYGLYLVRCVVGRQLSHVPKRLLIVHYLGSDLEQIISVRERDSNATEVGLYSILTEVSDLEDLLEGAQRRHSVHGTTEIDKPRDHGFQRMSSKHLVQGVDLKRAHIPVDVQHELFEVIFVVFFLFLSIFFH